MQNASSAELLREADFRRWVPDAEGLPAGADPLFRARERALSKGEGHDVSELRVELGRLGVVVRDRGERQYWRLPPALKD